MKEFTKKIVLENGSEFYGYGFGADKEAVCDLVFDTSMVGYQGILSDPSYTGQMVVMTYPLIGNYGITPEDYQTKLSTLGAMVVREYNDSPSNFRYTKTLSEELEDAGISAISGVDTRKLTKIIREQGVQKVLITWPATTVEDALRKIAESKQNDNLIERVSCSKRWFSRTSNHRFDVVAIDCGVRHATIGQLNDMGCNVTVVPYNTSVEDILAFRPDGLLVSNGPGDPHNAQCVIEVIKTLRGKLPILGLNLGHQLIALAYGAAVERMKFGHHGCNHPVRSLENGTIEIVSQNHLYVVDEQSLAKTALKVTHRNVLDESVEGVECAEDKVFSVQFYPETIAAPKNGEKIYEKFLRLMEERTNG